VLFNFFYMLDIGGICLWSILTLLSTLHFIIYNLGRGQGSWIRCFALMVLILADIMLKIAMFWVYLSTNVWMAVDSVWCVYNINDQHLFPSTLIYLVWFKCFGEWGCEFDLLLDMSFFTKSLFFIFLFLFLFFLIVLSLIEMAM